MNSVCFSPFIWGNPVAEKKRYEKKYFSRISLGDDFFKKKNYDLAQIEYQRELKYSDLNKNKRERVQSKLALSFLYQGQFAEALEATQSITKGDVSFQKLYLGMFAALKLGWLPLAQRKEREILALPMVTPLQKEQTLLLGGSVYIEKRNYNRVHNFYGQLQKKSKDKGIRQKSGQLLSALQRYEKKPKKNPWLSASLSTILPGSGYFYSSHYADGIMAFFFNVAFLGSALVLYDLENTAGRPHYASIGMGLVGLNFYVANIGGSMQSARRYNHFQTRVFHQEIRDSFFNTSSIEKTIEKTIKIP